MWGDARRRNRRERWRKQQQPPPIRRRRCSDHVAGVSVFSRWVAGVGGDPLHQGAAAVSSSG